MVPGLLMSSAMERNDRQSTELSIGGFTHQMDAQRWRQSDRWTYKRKSARFVTAVFFSRQQFLRNCAELATALADRADSRQNIERSPLTKLAQKFES
jgi:hypothetical protein